MQAMIAQSTAVDTLLKDLARAGIALEANGGDLQVRAPHGVMTQALRSEIRRHKAGLLAVLRPPEPTHTEPTPPPWAGQTVRIEDLEAFKARWFLQSVGGDWPDDAPCPRLCFRPACPLPAASNGKPREW